MGVVGGGCCCQYRMEENYELDMTETIFGKIRGVSYQSSVMSFTRISHGFV